MKKIIKVGLLVIALSSFLFGCTKRVGDNTQRTLKMGFQANTSSTEYMAAMKFAEKAKELSDGSLDIQIYAGGQLGDDRSMLEQVAAGALDMVYAETGRLGLWVEEAEIFGYPFAFDDFDHLKRTLSSPYGKKLHEKFLSKGWRVLSTGYNGTRQTTSNKAINSIDDMKGMKLRVPNAKANLKYAEYSGASPTAMAFGEVYLALKTNAVDGQENPLSTIDAQKFYEVQKYCALTNHILNDNNFIISDIIYNKLDASQQQAITKAALIAADYQTDLFMDDELKLIDTFKSKGVTITTPNKEGFRQACKPMFDEYIEKYGKEAVEAIEKARMM